MMNTSYFVQKLKLAVPWVLASACQASKAMAFIRVRPIFFDQVGHQTTNASIGNKYFLLNNVNNDQNYEQSGQMGTLLVNKVL